MVNIINSRKYVNSKLENVVKVTIIDLFDQKREILYSPKIKQIETLLVNKRTGCFNKRRYKNQQLPTDKFGENIIELLNVEYNKHF